jgi:hypothetical protein
MDINKYKNSNTSTMNIYKYNEHKQYNEHLKKQTKNKKTNKQTNNISIYLYDYPNPRNSENGQCPTKLMA